MKSKHERVIAVNRLEVIYQDLIERNNELKEIRNRGDIEERIFHANLNKSMKVRDEILEKISVKVGVPPSEIKEILKKDPAYQ